MMRARATLLTAIAATLIASAPAEAKKKPQPAPRRRPRRRSRCRPRPTRSTSVIITSAANIRRSGSAPRAGDAAIAQLLTVLRRAPIDGMANGPEVAASVEAAVQRARAASDAMQVKAAELALSAAWVDYVQALQAPVEQRHLGRPLAGLRRRAPRPHPGAGRGRAVACPARPVGVGGQPVSMPACAMSRSPRQRPMAAGLRPGDAQPRARADHSRHRQVHPRQFGRAAAAHVSRTASRSAR